MLFRSEVPPSDVVPVAERWSELAVSGSPEQKTVKRSYTPRNMAFDQAEAHARVTGGDTSEFGRPANQPCRMYPIWRKQLAHNFGLFAAFYAPTLTAAWLQQAARQPALIMVPIAQSSEGTCAMVSLREPPSVFGVARDKRVAVTQQGEAAAAFLGGILLVKKKPAPLQPLSWRSPRRRMDGLPVLQVAVPAGAILLVPSRRGGGLKHSAVAARHTRPGHLPRQLRPRAD